MRHTLVATLSLIIVGYSSLAHAGSHPFQKLRAVAELYQEAILTPREKCEINADTEILQPCLNDAQYIGAQCDSMLSPKSRDWCYQVYDTYAVTCDTEYRAAMEACRAIYPIPADFETAPEAPTE